METDWVSVFVGDIWHVKILQTELDGLGLETHVPDYVPMNQLYPTGGPTSGGELFVRRVDVELARELIAKKTRQV